MPGAISWQELEKQSLAKKVEVFTERKERFRRESISKNVKKGDHLVSKGSTNCTFDYEHHFLCTEVRDSADGSIVIEVVEYTGPNSNLSASSRASGSTDFTTFGKVQINTYTYEQLEKKGAKKEIWPEELERFDVEEVIRRAKRRVGESWYDALKNNCEHFVRWCKCGLNVSLQVKSWYTWAREALYSLVAGGKERTTQALANVSKDRLKAFLVWVFANSADELTSIFSKEYATTVVGFAFGVAIEGGVGFYEIKKAKKQREKGLFESKRIFLAKIVEIVAKGVCRSSLGIAGSFVGGTMFGPVWGSLIGGVIGGAAGHVVGYSIGWCYEKYLSDYIWIEEFLEYLLAITKLDK